MQDTRTSAPPVESAKHIAVRRRAKRGFIAGYIHELSARHGSAVPSQPAVEPAVAEQPVRSA